MNGTVIKGVGGLYTVKTDENTRVECRGRGLFRKDGDMLYVGDRVTVEDDVITSILPRKNCLSRPPVANIDKLILVAAHSDPDPNFYTIDKLLAIAVHHDIEPVLVFNKNDLPDELELEQVYATLPYPKFSVSTRTGENIDRLREALQASVCVFSGLSGVGKSSIINLLDPTLTLQTGEISKKLQRGKHTTRHVEFFDFCGGMIADTPGFSGIDLQYFNMKDRTVLKNCFEEFAPFEGKCRYADCTHRKEPGCAVREALEQGIIHPSRHENYIRLYDEMGEPRPWE